MQAVATPVKGLRIKSSSFCLPCLAVENIRMGSISWVIWGEFGGSIEPIITPVISLMPSGVLNEDSNNDLWSAIYSLTPDWTFSVQKKQGFRVLRAKESNHIVKKALCIKLTASYQRKWYKRSWDIIQYIWVFFLKWFLLKLMD